MKFAVKLILCLAVTVAASVLSTAQQDQSQSDAASSSQSKNDSQSSSQQKPASGDRDGSDKSQADKQPKPAIEEVGAGKVAGTSNDRLFYALPNFLTLQGQQKVPPLSSKDKFKVVALGTFDYFEYPWWGILAAINQAENNEAGYGQGWDAYAKRYGSTAGDSIIENFMVGAVYSSILHQDPRFYQSSKGGFWRRTGYAATRIVVTRSDSGHSQFNYSEVFGSATAATISTYSYHPRSTFLSTPTNPHMFVPSDRTFSHVLSTWQTQLTLDTITIMVKEFWPDIHRAMSHKSKNAKEAGAQP
jgi:hypothetical protein